MLVLTRRVGEKLMIGDDITITLSAVRGNQVRIGIAAPTNIAIFRSEICPGASQEKSQSVLKKKVS